MTVQERIESDLKIAMLAGDKAKAGTLRVIKSALLYEALSLGSKDKSLSEPDAQRVLARESKKRTEAADLYKKVDEPERAETELSEKRIIDAYLPDQLSQDDLKALVTKQIEALGATNQADMGPVISAVRQAAGPSADGAAIANLVREALAS